MSPGINDPTTAEQALDQLGGALHRLSGRSMPSALRVENGVRLLIKRPSFADYDTTGLTPGELEELRAAATPVSP